MVKTRTRMIVCLLTISEILSSFILIGLFFCKNSCAQVPVYNREFRLGLAYVTANRQVMPMDTAYRRIADAAEIAYIQGNWPEWESGIFDHDIQIARQKGLKIYLALDFLGYLPVARAAITLPPSLQTSLGKDTATFTTSGLSDAYSAFVKQLVKQYSPDYLVPMVEISLHRDPRPDSYNKFVQLYPQLYADIKTLSPSTLVGPSITYSDNTSPSGFGQEDKNTFKTFLADFEKNSDINAVSTYPYSFYPTATSNPLVYDLHPEAMPDTFLSELAGFSKNPLFISENSCVSHNFSVPLGSYTLSFNITPQDQKNYLIRLAQLAKIAQDNGKKISAINFTTLIDPTPQATASLIQTSPQLEWFCYLGLFDGTGVAKPAYTTLKEWKNDPYAPASILTRPSVEKNARLLKLSFTNSKVTLRGLQGLTSAKIITVDGKLVRDCFTDASGSLTWNFTDNFGKPAGKGIYLFLSPDKTYSAVIKRPF